MTATERLRQLLDERGVEYETYHDAAITEVDAVFWQDRNGQPCSAIGNADDIPVRMLSVQCVISPEQAVDATLGRGTCKLEQHGSLADQPSVVCWSCSECGFGWHHSIYDKQFSYCPNCGRRVIGEEDE